jgi:hypothetical protein
MILLRSLCSNAAPVRLISRTMPLMLIVMNPIGAKS